MTKLLIPFFLAVGANCFGQPLVCVSNGGVNPPVRAEGLAEPVGDFVVVCTGGTATPAGSPVPTTHIQLFLNTQVTSKLLGGSWSEALLTIDEPPPNSQRVCGTAGDTEASPGVCTITGTGNGAGVYSGAPGHPNVFQATVLGLNQLLFTGIPIDPPGTTGARIIRITNMRANANGLGVAPGNQAPTSVVAQIVPVSPLVLPISGLTNQAVGSVQTGMSTAVLGSAVLQQNTPQNAALAADPNASGVSQFSLRFRELFATSLRKRNIATSVATPAALANQNDLTIGVYNTESAFYNGSFPTVSDHGNLALAGLADTGTRVMARFSQVPPGVLLFSQSAGTSGGNETAYRLVSTDVNGAGPYAPVAGNSFFIAPLPVVNGSATAVYEVLQSDPNSFAIVDIPIYVAYAATPTAGIGLVTQTYAPLSTVAIASATESVPRFADTGTPGFAFSINMPPCATLGSSAASYGAIGGAGSITITGSGGCNWSASSASNWIGVPSGVSSGSGSINYTVAANDSPSTRVGTIVFHIDQPFVADQLFTVTQTGIVCAYTVSPAANSFASAGGTGSITVTPNSSQCAWTAVSNDGFVTVTSGSPGLGGGTVGYSVAANASASRTGTLTIAGQTFTINQQGQNVPSPGSLNSVSGSGVTRTFVFTFSDPDGWQDLGVVNVLINRFLDGRNACYLAYDRPSNVLYLVGDNGGGLTGLLLNGTGSVNNSQCTVNGVGSSASGSGNTLTLTVSLTFNQTAFGGEKVTFLAARDLVQNNSGWRTMGVWSVPGLALSFPLITNLTPSQGAGATQQFAITYRDVSSSANLRTMQILINSDLNGNLACYLGYDHANNVLYLVNDNNSGLLLPGIVPNSGTGTVQNSQCALSGAGTTKSEASEDLTLTVNLTFKSSFAGPKVVYTGVQTISNANSDWHALGLWNVP